MIIVDLAVITSLAVCPPSWLWYPSLFLILAPIAQAALAWESIVNANLAAEQSTMAPLPTQLLLYFDCFLLSVFIKWGYPTIFTQEASTLVGKYWITGCTKIALIQDGSLFSGHYEIHCTRRPSLCVVL